MRLATLSASDQPDALVLAILGDFGVEGSATMVRRLVEKLCAFTGPEEQRLREYLSMLEILADNRHLALNLQEPYTPCCTSTSNGCPAIRRVWNKEWNKAHIARPWQ